MQSRAISAQVSRVKRTGTAWSFEEREMAALEALLGFIVIAVVVAPAMQSAFHFS